MGSPRIRFTREDLQQLPEDWRAELIEGDLLMLPSPDPSHQLLMGRLYGFLLDHLGSGDRVLLAPCDVVLDEENVLQPDLLVLPEGTKPALHPWKIPLPVWVSEVLSPSTADRDRGIKLRLYARHGVREAWIVDQFARTIEVHHLEAVMRASFDADDTAVSRILPGLRVPVGEVFAV